MGAAVQSFTWENPVAYGYWLAQTYYFVRHTTSFLGLTASRFGHWQRDRQYRQIRHLAGESGHDQLLVNDLKTLGREFRDFPELPETSALYQSQYYFIDHEQPAAHFAYAYVLEGLAAKKIQLIYPRLTTIYPPEACRFLHVHMIEDQEHFEDGLDILDDLTAPEASSFLRNLQQTSYFYIAMLDHIQRVAGSM
jgi:hypothetical protein